MSFPVSSCTIFIQIWVDTNALQNGNTKGVYLVDNRVNNGSESEGTPGLNTHAPSGSYISWQLFNIDPHYNGELSIQSISNASVFGASGQAQKASDIQGAFVGQLQTKGVATYTINFTAQDAQGAGISVKVSPTLTVT